MPYPNYQRKIIKQEKNVSKNTLFVVRNCMNLMIKLLSKKECKLKRHFLTGCAIIKVSCDDHKYLIENCLDQGKRVDPHNERAEIKNEFLKKRKLSPKVLKFNTMN